MTSVYRKQQIADLALEADTIDEVKKRLEDSFKVSLRRTSHYHKFDFVTDDQSLFFEVKSRRNTRAKYPTTMIPFKKIEYARTKIVPSGGRAFFVFQFTDCLCLIEYNEEVFCSFEIKQGGRFDRGGPELNQYCWIPISNLVEISKLAHKVPSLPVSSSCQIMSAHSQSSDYQLPLETAE